MYVRMHFPGYQENQLENIRPGGYYFVPRVIIPIKTSIIPQHFFAAGQMTPEIDIYDSSPSSQPLTKLTF